MLRSEERGSGTVEVFAFPVLDRLCGDDEDDEGPGVFDEKTSTFPKNRNRESWAVVSNLCVTF